jgi:hypothetical protein
MNIWLLLLTLLNVILLAGLSFSLFLRIKEKKRRPTLNSRSSIITKQNFNP